MIQVQGVPINTTFTAITTIGYGIQAPETDEGRWYCIFYSLFGVPLNAVTILTVAAYMTMGTEWVLRRPGLLGHNNWKTMQRGCAAFFLSLIFFIVFIIVPTVCIVLTEDSSDSWSWIDSFYFCFITLSTIGFGDIVAGRTESNARGNAAGLRFLGEVALMLWIFLGLAYMVMVFNLITKAATTTVRKITQKEKAAIREQVWEMVEEYERRSRTSNSSNDSEIMEEIVQELTEKITDELANGKTPVTVEEVLSNNNRNFT